MFKKKEKETIKIGSIIRYKNELFLVNEFSDDKSMVFIEKKSWHAKENIITFCELVQVKKIEVIKL